MNRISLSVFLLSVLGLLSCKKDSEVNIDDQEAALIESYLDSLDLLKTAGQDTSGLYYYPITTNSSGKSQSEGKVLSFFYSMTLLDGSVVDQYDSLDSDTLVVKQGAGAIYPVGVDYALAYLKEGEKWGFVLPSRIAFGEYSYQSVIPENSIIKIEIELLEIRSENDVLEEELDLIAAYISDNDIEETTALSSGMVYKMIQEGTGSYPTADSTVSVAYEGRFLNDEVFAQASSGEPFQFVYGQDQTITCFENAVGWLKEGGTVLAISPSYLGYRESAQVIPPYLTDEMVAEQVIPTYASKVGPYKPLIFQIQLIDVN